MGPMPGEPRHLREAWGFPWRRRQAICLWGAQRYEKVKTWLAACRRNGKHASSFKATSLPRLHSSCILRIGARGVCRPLAMRLRGLGPQDAGQAQVLWHQLAFTWWQSFKAWPPRWVLKGNMMDKSRKRFGGVPLAWISRNLFSVPF